MSDVAGGNTHYGLNLNSAFVTVPPEPLDSATAEC
jgi:hypothetical protein